MNAEFDILTNIIRNRRAIYPASYRKESVDTRLIHRLIDNARWAPSHKLTQPWRFVILTDSALQRLSKTLSEYYKLNTPKETFSELKFKKVGERAVQSAFVIMICIQRSPENVIPAWEETAAVACAVQNMWLSASALGIGSYWSTPESKNVLAPQFSLPSNWECLGLFYAGWINQEAEAKSVRNTVDEISLHLRM